MNTLIADATIAESVTNDPAVIFPIDAEIPEGAVEYDDGLIYSADGELIGRRFNANIETQAEVPSVSYVDYILERTQKRDITVATLEAEIDTINEDLAMIEDEWLAQLAKNPTYAQLKERMSRLISMKRRAEKEAESIRAFFRSILEAFSKAMETPKSRTWKSLKGFGEIQRKKTPATIEIEDQERAVKLAEALGRGEKVKKSINLTDIKDLVVEAYAVAAKHSEGYDPFDASIPAEEHAAMGRYQVILKSGDAVKLKPETDELKVVTVAKVKAGKA